jgi:CheY-like chemotaxis protein
LRVAQRTFVPFTAAGQRGPCTPLPRFHSVIEMSVTDAKKAACCQEFTGKVAVVFSHFIPYYPALFVKKVWSIPMALPANILVVDDSLANGSVIVNILEAQGYLVSATASAEEAIPLFIEQDFDLVLTGLMLSGMSCFNMMKVFKRHKPEIDVIILTSNDSSYNIIKALRLGAYDYIVMPLDDESVLYNVIEKALEKQEQLRKKAHLLGELTRKNNGLQDTLEMMKSANQISAALMSTFSVPEIMKKLVELVTEHLRAHRGYLLLLDKSGTTLQAKVATGLDALYSQQYSLALGKGISGKVVEEGKPLIICDITDEGFVDDVREEDPDGAMLAGPSVLSVPLRVQDRVAGVLTISGGVSGEPFNNDHLEFLTLLSRYATIALANAGVVYNLKKQLAASSV